MPQDNKLLLKSLKKKHKNLMNQAYKLDLNEKERRKLIMQESSLILMQILHPESKGNYKF